MNSNSVVLDQTPRSVAFDLELQYLLMSFYKWVNIFQLLFILHNVFADINLLLCHFLIWLTYILNILKIYQVYNFRILYIDIRFFYTLKVALIILFLELSLLL